MADYVKTVWVDGATTGTPLIAANFNHDETQYDVAKAEYQAGNWGAPAAVPVGNLTGRLALSNMKDGAANYFLQSQGLGSDPVYVALTAAMIPNLDFGKITTGVVPVTQGGLGLASIAQGYIPYATSANTYTGITSTGANQVLRSTGAAALAIGALQAADIPNLSATILTSGTLSPSVLPAMSSGAAGAVPATGTPSGVKFLRDDSVWAIPAGSGGGGNVVGPASATNLAIALFDGTTGLLLRNSGVTIDVSGNVLAPTGAQFRVNGAQHQHVLADLISGTLPLVNLTDGTAAYYLRASGGSGPLYAQIPFSELASGQHTLAQEPRGTLNYFIRGQGVGSSPIYDVLAAADIPALPTSNITSGQFALAQMPQGTAGQYLRGAGAIAPTYSALLIGDLPTVTPAYGGTGQTSTPAKGDIPIGGSSILNLVGVGTNGKVLTANSGATYGVDWETPAAATVNGPTCIADFVVYNNAGTYTAYNPLTNAVLITSGTLQTVINACFTVASGGITGAVVHLRSGVYNVGAGLQLWGNGLGGAGSIFVGGRISGSGRGTDAGLVGTVLQAGASCTNGVVDLRAGGFTLDNVCINGGAYAASSPGLAFGGIYGDSCNAYYSIITNVLITNVTDGILMRDQWYYNQFISCRVMNGISQYGLHFAATNSSSVNDGQTLWLGCEFDGGAGSVYNSSAAITFLERLVWDRCMFSGGYNSNCRMLFLENMRSLVFLGCDYEASNSGFATNHSTNPLIYLDGHSVLFDGGQMSASYAINWFTSGNSYSPNTGYNVHGVKFYASNSTGSDTTVWISKSAYPINFTNCTLAAYGASTGNAILLVDYYPWAGSTWTAADVGRTTGQGARRRPVFIDHFFGTTLDPKWTKTVVGTGAAALMDAAEGGAVLMQTGGTNGGSVLLDFNNIRTINPGHWCKFETQLTPSASGTNLTMQFGLRYDANNYLMITQAGTASQFQYDSCSSSTHTTGNLYTYSTNSLYMCIEVARGVYSVSTSSTAAYYGRVVFHLTTGGGAELGRIEVTTNIPTNYLEPYLYIANGATSANYTAQIDFVSIEEG